jgi:hypothetical protein
MKKTSKTNSAKPAEETVPTTTKEHTEMFARAMRLFHASEYGEARALFEMCAEGPEMTVKEPARMYSRMCARRLEKAEVVLSTAEDHYTYAVSLMNVQNYRDALPHLQKAVQMGDGAHVRYALALGVRDWWGTCLGRWRTCRGRLRWTPRRVGLARADSDFQPLLQDAVIRELVTGPRN